MPPLLTQIARSSDGLPLVTTQTPSHGMTITSKHQQEAKELVRNITHGAPNRMSIESGNCIFSYMTREGLCFLTLTEEKYSRRLAFVYLEEIADAILGELIKEFGDNWRTEVQQTARPFRFIQYDPIIQRKQREFRDGGGNSEGAGGSASSSRLNEDLTEIQSIMRKNIDEILNRGEKLENVSNISGELREKSNKFKWGAKKLTWQARLQQYGPMAIGTLIVLIVLYVKIFHIGF